MGAVEQALGAVVHFCIHLHPGCGQRHKRLPWRPGTQLKRTLACPEEAQRTECVYRLAKYTIGAHGPLR